MKTKAQKLAELEQSTPKGKMLNIDEMIQNMCKLHTDYATTSGVNYLVDLFYLCLYKHFERPYACMITDVYAKLKGRNSQPTVYVTLKRPGLLIGKGGNDIDTISNMMKTYLNCREFHIELTEDKDPTFNSY